MKQYPSEKKTTGLIVWPLRGIAVLILLSLLAISRTWKQVANLRSRVAI